MRLRLTLMPEQKRAPQITDPTGRTVAANVRRHRERQGLSTYDLSRLLSEAGRPMTPAAVGRIERAERRVDVGDLMALAVVLNIAPASLLLPPDDNPSTVVELLPGRAPDGGEVTVTAGRLWDWADGQQPLFGHPDPEQEIQGVVDFIRFSRPPIRRRIEMMRALEAFREDGTDG